MTKESILLFSNVTSFSVAGACSTPASLSNSIRSFLSLEYYRATESLSCSVPKFIRNGIDPHVIEYCDLRSTWIIKECSTDQVLATSRAVTSDFSIPFLRTTSDHASAQQLPAISSTPSFTTQSYLGIASRLFSDLRSDVRDGRPSHTAAQHRLLQGVGWAYLGLGRLCT
jgi:hypothetical protein